MSDPIFEPRWTRWTGWLIGGLLIFRLVYAAAVPLDLVHDEAYYWDWSRQLDWGYFSKPPMVAWLIALSTAVGGSTPAAVRLPAVLLGTLGLIWIYLLAARLYGRKTGFWAVLLAAATPGNAALALLMTIDAPFVFCWCAALYALWRFLEGGPSSSAWIAAATLFTGLGLLSKQTMLVFLPLALLFLLVSPEDRPRLRQPGVWVWAFGSLFFLAPVAWWNIRHDWITVQHTREHFSLFTGGLLTAVLRFGEFLALQFGIGAPMTMALFAAVLLLAGRRFSVIDRRARYLFCFSGVPMAAMLGLAWIQPVEPNWTAGFVPAGFVLGCGWALGQVSGIRAHRAGNRYLGWASITGAGCLLATYLLPLGFGLQGSRFDIAIRMRGWREVGQAADAAWRKLSLQTPAFVVTTLGRTMAAELAFYLPAQPPAYTWNESGLLLSQYDFWSWPSGHQGGNVLIVTLLGSPPPARLAAAFRTIDPAGEVTVRIGRHIVHQYQLWRGLDYLGLPSGFGRPPWPANR